VEQFHEVTGGDQSAGQALHEAAFHLLVHRGEELGVRRDTRKALRGIRQRYTLEAARSLEGFDRPVLFAWAADDTVFPLSGAERLARALPDAHVEPIADSLALVPEDQPERLAALVAAWLPAALGGVGSEASR
jgi:pimeloyl-ACP methyl ester carboxylesterase